MMPQKVVCTECGYSPGERPADENTAAEYIIEHEREHGHQLRIETMPGAGDKEEV